MLTGRLFGKGLLLGHLPVRGGSAATRPAVTGTLAPVRVLFEGTVFFIGWKGLLFMIQEQPPYRGCPSNSPYRGRRPSNSTLYRGRPSNSPPS